MYIRYKDRLEMMEKAAMLNALRAGVTNVARAARPMLTRAGSSLRTLGGDLAGGLKTGFGGMRNALSQARTTYGLERDVGSGVLSSARQAAGHFGTLAGQAVSDMGRSIRTFGRGLQNETLPWLRNAGRTAGSTFRMLPGAQQNAIKGTALAAGTLGAGYTLGRATAPNTPGPVDPYANMG